MDGLNRIAADPRIQYGGDQLERACELVDRCRRGAPVPGVFRLDDARSLWSVMTSLPRMSVTLTSSPSGREIKHHLGLRRWGVPKNRIAQAVLPLPASEESYLRRGHRIVRRQVRRARAAGVSCEVLNGEGDRAGIRRSLTPRMPGLNGWLDLLPYPSDACWWVARSADGDPIGLAVVVADSEWALLRILLSKDHPARYLLHTEMAVALAQTGVRHLMTSSPPVPRLEPNVRYFQRMLGYQVAHLTVR